MDNDRSQLRVARLQYNGIVYPNYFVCSNKRLFRQLKSKDRFGRPKFKEMKCHPQKGGYELWYPRNPRTGKHHPGVIVSRAVAESFAPAGTDTQTLVAAHIAGTKRSDGALGTCVLKTQEGNRQDRWRDGTHSTGHNTVPGKLRKRELDVVQLYDTLRNKSAVSRYFGVTRQAVYALLKKHGRK